MCKMQNHTKGEIDFNAEKLCICKKNQPKSWFMGSSCHSLQMEGLRAFFFNFNFIFLSVCLLFIGGDGCCRTPEFVP